MKVKANVDSLRENRKEFIKINKSILKSQQRFRSEKNNLFTEKVKKIALSANNNKGVHLMDSIETKSYGINKEIIHRKEEIKSVNIIKYYKK